MSTETEVEKFSFEPISSLKFGGVSTVMCLLGMMCDASTKKRKKDSSTILFQSLGVTDCHAGIIALFHQILGSITPSPFCIPRRHSIHATQSSPLPTFPPSAGGSPIDVCNVPLHMDVVFAEGQFGILGDAS